MTKSMQSAVNANKLNTSRYCAATLAGCVLLAALICYAQLRGSSALIAVSLSAYLLFHIWACVRDTAFAELLFFLPWSPLMKLYPGSISFFTIALLTACVIYLAKNRFLLEIYQIVLTAMILIVTLTAKTIWGNSLDKSYMVFMAMLLLFPCVVKRTKDNADFWELTLFFACGIITAALSAQQVVGYPNITRYIKVHSYLSITRLSGYYGDPNFYSAHITACLAGVLVIFNCEKNAVRRRIMLALALILLYCGLLSVSKSFIIVAACAFLAWIPAIVRQGSHSRRFGLLLGILCIVLAALSLTVFRDLLKDIDERFAYASNISDLTTGRTDIWSSYLEEFMRNAPLTIFGEGFSDVLFNGRASHNSLIQGIYQFGLIGFPLLLAWIVLTLKKNFCGADGMKAVKNYALIMLIGVVLPWMALDIIFFDELFLLPVYAAIGVSYAAKASEAA